jgi:YHS domain-containing protein
VALLARDVAASGKRFPAIPDSVTDNPVTNGISFKEITTMRSITSLIAAGLLACSMGAIAADDGDTIVERTEGRNPVGDQAIQGQGSVVRDATVHSRAKQGEYGNECAWGLSQGKHVMTDCSINMTRADGKTYCFSSDKAMDAFMKNPVQNMSRSTEAYGRS